MICSSERKSHSLQGYKVIGISTGIDKGKQVMTIDMITNLWNEKLKVNSDLFTIGTVNVQNVDLKSDSPIVNFRNKFTGNSQSLHSFFNKDNTHLHAIAIVYKKGYSFPELVINAKKPFIAINSDILELIKSNLIDLIVYGTKSSHDNCEIFTNLYNEYATKEYVLREFDNKNSDRTLNRCALDGNAFSPEKFKLGSPTPGGINDCNGPHFFLNQLLLAKATPVQQDAHDLNNIDDIDELHEQSNSPQCTTSSSTYQSLSDDTIEETLAEEIASAAKSSCTVLNLGANAGNIADEVDRVNRRKRLWSGSDDDEETCEWQSLKHFK